MSVSILPRLKVSLKMSSRASSTVLNLIKLSINNGPKPSSLKSKIRPRLCHAQVTRSLSSASLVKLWARVFALLASASGMKTMTTMPLTSTKTHHSSVLALSLASTTSEI